MSLSPQTASDPPGRPVRGRRRPLVVIAVLGIGWTVAAGVYFAASPPVEDDEEYEMRHSKRTRRELERIGGKAALLASEANDWIEGLWHGRTLAATIAVGTALAAGAYWLVPRP